MEMKLRDILQDLLYGNEAQRHIAGSASWKWSSETYCRICFMEMKLRDILQGLHYGNEAQRHIQRICFMEMKLRDILQGLLSGVFCEAQEEGGSSSRMMEVDFTDCVSNIAHLDTLLSAVYTGSLKLSLSNVAGNYSSVRHLNHLIQNCLPGAYCLVDIVVKASTSRAEDLGFDSCLHHGDFARSSHSSNLKMGTPVLPCVAPGVIGSVLGLVGLVSVYCDWVR